MPIKSENCSSSSKLIMLAKNFLTSKAGLCCYGLGNGNSSMSTPSDPRSFALCSAMALSPGVPGLSSLVKRKMRLLKLCFSTLLNS